MGKVQEDAKGIFDGTQVMIPGIGETKDFPYEFVIAGYPQKVFKHG